MKIFMINQFGRTVFYIIKGDSEVYVSRNPSLTGVNYSKSTMSVNAIVKMCDKGVAAPFNSEAVIMIREHYKKERNKNMCVFFIATAIAIGSIIFGVCN